MIPQAELARLMELDGKLKAAYEAARASGTVVGNRPLNIAAAALDEALTESLPLLLWYANALRQAREALDVGCAFAVDAPSQRVMRDALAATDPTRDAG